MSINNIMDTMTTTSKRTRRRHSPELKAKILAECDLPSASVAKIAMSHGINANIVHSWRKRERQAPTAAGSAVTTFVPVAMEPPTDAEAEKEQCVSIELHRAGLLVKLTWPLSAAEKLSAWTRELLR